MNRRILFVGVNPSGKERRIGCAILRLKDWWKILEISGETDFVNCIPFPGKIHRSLVRTDLLMERVSLATHVVALGNFPSEVLNKLGVEHHQLPHPSPRNRMINDVDLINHRLMECKRYLETK